MNVLEQKINSMNSMLLKIKVVTRTHAGAHTDARARALIMPHKDTYVLFECFICVIAYVVYTKQRFVQMKYYFHITVRYCIKTKYHVNMLRSIKIFRYTVNNIFNDTTFVISKYFVTPK